MSAYIVNSIGPRWECAQHVRAVTPSQWGLKVSFVIILLFFSVLDSAVLVNWKSLQPCRIRA